MGEPALRCTECAGKLGPPGASGKCEVCWLLGRLKDHLLSPRFPPQGTVVTTAVLKETLHRVLEISESYWAFDDTVRERGEALEQVKKEEAAPQEKGPKEEAKLDKKPDKEEPTEDPKNSAKKLNLYPKFAAKPVDKTATQEEEDTGGEFPFSAPSSGSKKAPEFEEIKEEVVREEKDKKQKKEKKESKKSRSRSQHRRRKRTSGENHSSPRDRKRRRDGQEEDQDRRRPRPSRRPSEGRRSPLRPRTPSRSPGRSKWQGPIFARGRNPEPDLRRRDSSPKYTNKGAKKREQQARAKGKGKRQEKLLGKPKVRFRWPQSV